jgi:hypothetical protein
MNKSPIAFHVTDEFPDFSDVILQRATDKHLAMSWVYPFRITDPRNLVVAIIVVLGVILKSYAIAIHLPLLDGVYL